MEFATFSISEARCLRACLLEALTDDVFGLEPKSETAIRVAIRELDDPQRADAIHIRDLKIDLAEKTPESKVRGHGSGIGIVRQSLAHCTNTIDVDEMNVRHRIPVAVLESLAARVGV